MSDIPKVTATTSITLKNILHSLEQMICLISNRKDSSDLVCEGDAIRLEKAARNIRHINEVNS